MLEDTATRLWQLYVSPTEAWEAMLDACAKAKVSIDCEQYIFEPDAIGERFVNICIQKAKEGVQIRLLCDGVGSYPLVDSPLLARFRDAGGNILFYNRIRLRKTPKLISWFLRDHRKVLIVDSRTAFMGGIGITEDQHSWRDTDIRINTEVVQDIQESFETMWEIALHKRDRFTAKKYPAGASFQLLNNSPRPRHRHIYKTLLKDIKESKKYLYLATAYFVPSFRLNHALIAAAKRGVDVRIMMPLSSDTHIVDVAARSHVTRLLRAGAKVYRYQGMFHAKTAVADDAWASIGSANLDNLSLLFNYETSIRSLDQKCIQEMKGQFIRDMNQCEQIVLESWLERPFFEKCKEFITRPLHGLL